MRGMRLAVFFLTALLLTACTSPQGSRTAGGALTPMPEKPTDPGNDQLKEAILAFLADTGAPVSSRYMFSRIDLDGDGRREALVLFKTPYGYWCDLHGCTMLVYKAEEKGFTLTGSVQPVREPVYASALTSHGWRHLIVHVSGRWDATKDVLLQFDGRQYPASPDSLPAYLRYASNQETEVFGP